MSKHVYCEKCLDVIEEYEELVILNGKPYHYHCYEKELSEQKKKSIIERYITWRFINNGLIGNLQALLAIIIGAVLYLFGENFADGALCRLFGTLIIIFTILIRLYAFLNFEIKAKKSGKRSMVLQNRDSVLQLVRVEAIDLLKVLGTIVFIMMIWNIISTLLM